MTFDVTERSRRKGKPVELYFFQYGSGLTDFYAYTNTEIPITVTLPTFGDVEFTPLPIDRGGINSSGSLDKSGLKVSVPLDSGVASLFANYPPTEVVSLIIRSGHASDTDSEFLVVWSGRILSYQLNESTAELNCEPISTSMRRTGCKRVYSLGCPLALYSTGLGMCNADKEAATIATTADAVTVSTVTLHSDWETSDRKALYRGGMLEWDRDDGAHEIRTILQVNTSTDLITLAGPTRGLVSGATVSVVRGCNHKLDGCEDHDNIQNYGGQWLIPLTNPFGQTNNFY